MSPKDPALTRSQRELVRLLSIVLLDNERPEALLVDALGSAGRERLPTDEHELLRFAERHLGPRLADEIGENFSSAFLRDLSEAIGPRDEVMAKKDAPKLLDSAPTMVGRARIQERDAIPAAHGTAHGQDGRRPSILVVHSDRVVRAGLARALLNARFDVDVFDAISELVPTPIERVRVVALDIAGRGAEATLRSLAQADPGLRVLAWTALDSSVAEDLLSQWGVRRFAVCAKTATATEVVECTRQLVRD